MHVPARDEQDAVDEFDLAGLDEAFASAPDQDEPIPDGIYEVIIDRVELKRSKASGSRMLEWEMRIAGPDHAGRKLWKYSLLETADHMTYVKREFRKVGFELPKLSDLPSRLGELLDLRLEVVKKTRGEFESVYFRKRLEGNGEGEGDGTRVF
jgi:hypothetical protein